jgi:hypothetical protein
MVRLNTFLALATLASMFGHEAIAAEQHLKFESMTGFYTLTFDDSKIAEDAVKRIAWLSPFIDPDSDGDPFVMTGSQDGREKMIVVRPVESCTSGSYECFHPSLNARFMQQGEENLAVAEKQINELRTENLPEIMEPIRAYLLKTAEFFLKTEQARFQYFRSGERRGDVRGLREHLCSSCKCGDSEENVLSRMGEATTSESKLKLSNEWYNMVAACARSKFVYPVESWKQAIKTLRIQESSHAKHIN